MKIVRSFKRLVQYSYLFLLPVLLIACVTNSTVNNQQHTEFDFDHEIQFSQTQLDEYSYRIEVVPNNKVNFGRLSAFLLRQSLLVCGGYGYQLTVLSGIKSVDHLRESPNLIMQKLTAKLKCPIDTP
ncbi:hypothetical protein [Colwellia echini]|uniref:Lipoprotein n=1 Tax=Colwellia echini TaxID=1982103 RepID=A0ABY3MTZ1_9GAMM|nr:hypothetical protein [Colwellia echini]TYK64650.1 hypothetical protein CWS31_014450 [Colwellia echini]